MRIGDRWIETENQRMDAMIVVDGGRAFCRPLRDLRAGDRIVVGLRGIRVTPESKERDRLSFAFMSNGISSERQVETAVRQTAALVGGALWNRWPRGRSTARSLPATPTRTSPRRRSPISGNRSPRSVSCNR